LVEISHRERVVRAKIIYYGPAAGGKTTNLVVLHRRADPKRRGEMVSVNSTQDRTILLDLLPMKTPAFRGYELRFQVIAVPGQRMYAASRKLLLNGADAVVFVANSAADRWEETIQSLREMNQNLLAHGLDPTTIPVTYQYNKRDLPEVTSLEAMERTLNARHTASFPAVAIREEGVIETFAAVLQLTMEDIATRFKLGANIRNARSIEEWNAESMRAMFGWSPSTDADMSQTQAPTPESMANMEREPRDSPATAATQGISPVPSRVAVKVPVARSIEGATSPSAATDASDPQAAEALVDSYAQAAADLTSALEDMRDQRDSVDKQLADLGAPFLAAQSLLEGTPSDEVLKALVMRLVEGLGAVSGSLSLLRHDSELHPVILHGLQREPLVTIVDASKRPLGTLIIESGTSIVFVAGEPGPIGQVLDKSGGKLTSMVAIPVRSAVRNLGLLTFYLPPESAPPHKDATKHLDRLGDGVALVLELAAGAVAKDRLVRAERYALIGRLAEQAIVEMGPPLDRLFSTMGRLRTQPDGPDWLTSELLGMGKELSRTKRFRDAVLEFMAGQPPAMNLIPLGPVFQSVRAWTADSLERHAVRLETTELASTDRVRADDFLLRSALAALVERAEHDLTGTSGGLIRLSAHIDAGKAYIQVADNITRVRQPREGGKDYVAWALDRHGASWPLSFVSNVVDYFQGEWTSETSDQGNELTLILPAQ
jgi:signal recognition particle receptor subunit beta